MQPYVTGCWVCTHQHDEVVRCIHLHPCGRYYELESLRMIRLHSVHKAVSNRDVEFRVDTHIKTDIKVPHDRVGIVVLEKCRKLATLNEISITSQEYLQTVRQQKRASTTCGLARLTRFTSLHLILCHM